MGKTVHIFILAEGLGWQIAEKRGVLREILEYRNSCTTVLGSSSTCNQTLLTGKLPQEHGQFSYYVKAGENRPFKYLQPLALLPKKIGGYTKVRKTLSRIVGPALGYSRDFQLHNVPFSQLPYLDCTEKKAASRQDNTKEGFSLILDHWKNSGRTWMQSSSQNSDDQNFADLMVEVSKGKVELCFLSTSSLADVMHRRGTDSMQVDREFSRFQAHVRNLFKVASKYYQTVNLHVFSSHGMAPVTKLVDMMPRLEKLRFKYGKDYVAVWDSTMARFWFLNDLARSEITAWLDAQPVGNIVPEDKLQAWGCDFPDKKFGELFYLLPAGSLFMPSFMNKNYLRGMNCYSPEEPSMAACWLTNCREVTAEHVTDIHKIMKQAAESGSSESDEAQPAQEQASAR